MFHRFRNSARLGRGATSTELLVLFIVVSFLFIGAFKIFGGTIKAKLSGAQSSVTGLGVDDKSSEESGTTAPGSGEGNTTAGSGGFVSDDGAQISSDSTDRRPTLDASRGIVKAEPKRGSVGGFNPWILLIFCGLIGLLVYVFFAKKN